MNRTSVTSSYLLSVGYEEATQTLEAEFSDQRVFQYYGVPRHVFDELLAASSVGSYFYHNVRTSYPYSEV